MQIPELAQVNSPGRRQAVRAALLLEVLTVAWMAVESGVAIAAAAGARSVALGAFGTDSLIELLSGALLLWRLAVEQHASSPARVNAVEARAAWLAAGLLVLLCLYVLAAAAGGLALRLRPEGSVPGLLVAGAALVGMPLLAAAKRRANRVLGSAALQADIAESIACAYLAGAVLAAVALNTFLGWWWADYAGAILMLVWLVPETREAIEGAREGRVRCC